MTALADRLLPEALWQRLQPLPAERPAAAVSTAVDQWGIGQSILESTVASKSDQTEGWAAMSRGIERLLDSVRLIGENDAFCEDTSIRQLLPKHERRSIGGSRAE